MSLGPWIAVAIVLAVPLLVTSDTGRRWLIRGKHTERVWAALLAVAMLGSVLAFWALRGSARIAAATLVTTPLVQAIVFASADRLFQVLTGRVPVSFYEARDGRRKDGKRYWPDKFFWIVVFLGLIVGSVFVCAPLGIEFPSRNAR
jgi:hypothetical protein